MQTTNKLLFIFIVVTTAFPAISQESFDSFGFPSNKATIDYSTNKIVYSTKNIIEIQVLRSFVSPTTMPSGIASDGQNLWVCGYNEYQIFKVSSIDGCILQTFPVNIQRPYGIAYINDTIFLLDNNSKKIFEYNALDGTCLDTLCPQNLYFGIIFPTGLLYLDNQFIFNDNKGPQPGATGDSIFFFNNSYVFIKGLSSFGNFSSGIAYDGEYLWINDNPSQTSNRINPINWQIAETIRTPGGMYPNGITFDGENMWIINNESDSIYMFVPDSITNLHLNNTNDQIAIYPNPVHGQFYILLNNVQVKSVTILSLDGRIITHEEISTNRKNLVFDTNKLNMSKGVYIVSLSGNYINEPHKLIVK